MAMRAGCGLAPLHLCTCRQRGCICCFAKNNKHINNALEMRHEQPRQLYPKSDGGTPGSACKPAEGGRCGRRAIGRFFPISERLVFSSSPFNHFRPCHGLLEDRVANAGAQLPGHSLDDAAPMFLSVPQTRCESASVRLRWCKRANFQLSLRAAGDNTEASMSRSTRFNARLQA